MIYFNLKNLANFLKLAGQEAEQKAVLDLSKRVKKSPKWDDWAEAAEEYGEEPVSEDEYLRKNIAEKPKFTDQFEDMLYYEDALYTDYLKDTSTLRNYGKVEQDFINILEQLYKEILEKEDIHIFSGKNGNILGAGKYSRVFNAIYKNRHVAAKVVLGDTGKEKESYGLLHKIEPELPEDIAKYFVKIYEIKTGTVEKKIGFYIQKINYSIIITEALQPLQAEYKRILKNLSSYRRFYFTQPMTEDELYNLAKFLQKKLPLIINDISVTDIFNFLYNYLGPHPSLYHFQKFTNHYKELFNLSPKFRALSIKDKTYILNQGRSTINNFIAHHIEEWLHRFPEAHFVYRRDNPEYQSINPYITSDPQIHGLIEALKYLALNYKFEWNDLHPANFMIDSNGQLKVVDVGNFE